MLGQRVVVNERELFSRRPWKEDFLLGDRCGDEIELFSACSCSGARFVRVSSQAKAALVSEEAMAECVRAGCVTMETVQSIEPERGHCRVRIHPGGGN